jgi:hypothetical protein
VKGDNSAEFLFTKTSMEVCVTRRNMDDVIEHIEPNKISDDFMTTLY